MLESKNLHNSTAMIEVDDWVAPRSLAELNLENELIQQLNAAKQYLADSLSDPDLPPNQIAQVMNTVAAITKQIIAMQGELHNQESIKRMEAAMIHALKLAPPDIQDAFLNSYRASLRTS